MVDVCEYLTTGKCHLCEGRIWVVRKENENQKRNVDPNCRLCIERVYNSQKVRNGELSTEINILRLLATELERLEILASLKLEIRERKKKQSNKRTTFADIGIHDERPKIWCVCLGS